MDEVNEALKHLTSLHEEDASGSPAWFTSLVYSHLGDNKQTFYWLQKSVDKHEVEMIWLREEPALRHLHNDPRYLNIYKQVGFNVPPKVSPEGTTGL